MTCMIPVAQKKIRTPRRTHVKPSSDCKSGLVAGSFAASEHLRVYLYYLASVGDGSTQRVSRTSERLFAGAGVHVPYILLETAQWSFQLTYTGDTSGQTHVGGPQTTRFVALPPSLIDVHNKKQFAANDLTLLHLQRPQ